MESLVVMDVEDFSKGVLEGSSTLIKNIKK